MKVGLVLSGGGMRGIAHLGVAKALYEKKIPISIISGTSSGAILGAFLAHGYHPDDIMSIFFEINFFKLIRSSIRSLSSSGLLNMDRTSPVYKKYLPEKFEDLSIPFTAAITNFGTGSIQYRSSGPLIEAIQASSCIPAIFKPVELDGEMYVDGGLLDNFPVETIIHKCDFIIGSTCNYLSKIEKLKGLKHIIERSILMAISVNNVSKKNLCNAVIEPTALDGVGIFHIKRAGDIFHAGYTAAMHELEINESLIWLAKRFQGK